MNYFNIRKLSYTDQRKVLLSQFNVDMDDWIFSPYTCLKLRFAIEFSSIIVWLLQSTSVTPNFITFLSALLGVIGCLLLSSGTENLIIAGVIVFFCLLVFDIVDGTLARITKQTSLIGNVFDPWAGLVCSFGFLVGLGMYLYNTTQEIHFIYLMILIIIIRALDLRIFAYHYLMYDFYMNHKFIKKKKTKEKKGAIKDNKLSKNLILLKKFFQSFLDDRSRTIDTIGLIILIELTYDKIILTNFIYYLILVKTSVIFAGGFYLIFFKGLITKISSRLKN